MSITKIVVSALASCLAIAAIAAPSPVGSWTGHIHLVPPGNLNPQQEKAMKQGLAMYAKVHIVLVLKSDHTFISDLKGGPQPLHKTGKWALAGTGVKLTTPQGSQQFAMNSSGNKLTLNIPPQRGVKGEVVFTR